MGRAADKPRYMRSGRALLASIGTGAMLVAAAALALFSVSAIFALGGFESASADGHNKTLVLELQSSGSDPGRTVEATVASASERSSVRSRSVAARRSARRRDPVRANADATTNAAAATSQVDPLGDGTSGQPPTAKQPPASEATPEKPSPNLGDGVKQLGDGLSSTVQQVGTTLAEVTTPLSPTLAAAVAQVLTVVAGLLQSTTDALGGALGATP